MDTLLKDLRYGIRSLLRQPAFTSVAVLTLALGIGANSAIFSVINTLILTPPAFAEPNRVVSIWQTPVGTRKEGYVSYLDLQDWQSRNQTFEEIAGYKLNGFVLLNNGEAEQIQGMRITANFLPMLKVTPVLGRNFVPDEEKRGSQKVALISYDFWQTQFGGDPNILNRQQSLDGQDFTIIGVLPQHFEFPLVAKDVEVLTTVTGEAGNLKERGAHVLKVVGRLKPSVSLEGAQTDITRIAASLAQEYPQSNTDTTAFLVSAHEQLVGRDLRQALWLLLGAVGFTLLIACSNTANLLLVRASTRQKEIAIRSALGASRWRIARSLFVESILMSLIAGAAGLFLAVWGLAIIKYYAADQLPRITEVSINSKVLLFTLVVSLLTGLLFSLVPTLKASHPDINEVLKSSSKSATSGRSLRLWRNSLVVSEVALSLILLVGAGLMIKSFSLLTNVPPGFDPKNVLTGRISLTSAEYVKPEQCVLYVNQTLAKLKSIPGVEAAAFVAPMPFSGGNVYSDFRIEGRPVPEAGREPSASNRSVTPEYFASMKIRLLKGRFFTDQDKRGQLGAAIINETLANAYFAGEVPIGKVISHIGANQNEGDPEQWQIVGVVGDVHHSSLTNAARPEIYLPYEQNSWSWGNFMVRTTVPPTTLSDAFRREVKAADKSVAITNVRPLEEAISETVTQPRFYTFLFALFGGIGLLLTVTGVYSLISYTVAQRTQEIGIRMALGASRRDVVRMILGQGITLAIVGSVVGLAISFWITRLIVKLLFEVTPTDLFTFGVATLLLLFSALLASYLPARRATKVDPIVALRFE
ncbi:MAG TPA: ABC transporter permease [Pyrinomonadaceae bacterium]|jgi:Acidobacterial duplicated orphan permease|nr:ABC transporter permease [Pyrinomonadaceae bacterium]